MKLLSSKSNTIKLRFRCALSPWPPLRACSLRCLSRPCLAGAGSNGDSSKVDVDGGGGLNGGGSKRNDDGRSDGSDRDAPPPSHQPLWLKVLLCVTFVVYLFVRMQWRRDLQRKMDQIKREEEVMEREERAWSEFLQEQGMDSKKNG